MEVRDEPARLVRGGHESELDRQVARQLAEVLVVETAVATIRFALGPVSRAAFACYAGLGSTTAQRPSPEARR